VIPIQEELIITDTFYVQLSRLHYLRNIDTSRRLTSYRYFRHCPPPVYVLSRSATRTTSYTGERRTTEFKFQDFSTHSDIRVCTLYRGTDGQRKRDCLTASRQISTGRLPEYFLTKSPIPS